MLVINHLFTICNSLSRRTQSFEYNVPLILYDFVSKDFNLVQKTLYTFFIDPDDVTVQKNNDQRIQILMANQSVIS